MTRSLSLLVTLSIGVLGGCTERESVLYTLFTEPDQVQLYVGTNDLFTFPAEVNFTYIPGDPQPTLAHHEFTAVTQNDFIAEATVMDTSLRASMPASFTGTIEVQITCHQEGLASIDLEGVVYTTTGGYYNGVVLGSNGWITDREYFHPFTTGHEVTDRFQVDCLPNPGKDDANEGPGSDDHGTGHDDEEPGSCSVGGAPEMDNLIRVGNDVFGPGTVGADALCAFADDQVSTEPVLHSSEDISSVERALDHTSTFARGGIRITLTQAELDNLAYHYPCGQHGTGQTLCDSQDALSPGDYIVAYNVLHSDVVTDDGEYYTYGFPFDGDGDLTNNYVSMDFPNDFYQTSDRWWAASKLSEGDFMLESVDARDGYFDWMQTDARMLVTGNLVMLVVPASEFEVDLPTHRATCFNHLGDWGYNDPWYGDVQPTVAQGLTPIEDATAWRP